MIELKKCEKDDDAAKKQHTLSRSNSNRSIEGSKEETIRPPDVI